MLARSLRIGAVVGAITLVALLPLLVLPSQDDVARLYSYFIQGNRGSVALHENLALVRLVPAPIYLAARTLGVPDFALEMAAFLAVPFALATLAAALFLVLLRRADLWLIAPLTLVAVLSPGLFEIHTFWITRVSLLVSAVALIAHVVVWVSLPRWRVPSTFLVSLVAMLSYPGALNIALAVFVLLGAGLVADRTRSWSSIGRELALVAAAIITAAVVFAVVVAVAGSVWTLYGDKFGAIPLAEIPAKAFGILQQFMIQLTAARSTRVVVALTLGATAIALVAAGRSGAARKVVAVCLAIAGTFVVGLQLPSLPLEQSYYAPRTFLFIFLSLAGIVCLASVSIRGTARAVVVAAALSAAAVSLTTTMWRTGSYVAMRVRDVSAATRFVGMLDDIAFDWSRPIVVDFGDWTRFMRWGPGLYGGLAPILSQRWSSSEFVALVAGRAFVPPTPEMRADAAATCALDRPAGIGPRVTDRGTYVALCL